MSSTSKLKVGKWYRTKGSRWVKVYSYYGTSHQKYIYYAGNPKKEGHFYSGDGKLHRSTFGPELDILLGTESDKELED